MKSVKMIIDGKEVHAKEGLSLLEAARAASIDIPTLCHDKRLSPYGACRLCSVEIVKGKKSSIVASCVYPVENGLEVKTDSPRVKKIRKVLLELMLAISPGGDVAKLAEKYQADPEKFKKKPTFCILCGLCVRYCSEVKNEKALAFIGRGVERQVTLISDIASKSCISCGECFYICPTCIIPNKFTLSLPSFAEKHPVLFPVRLHDDGNLQQFFLSE